jgi:tetratricopeptide (TPR) repeat protein
MHSMTNPATIHLAQASAALNRYRYPQALHAAQIALAELEQAEADPALQAEAHELAGAAAINCGEYLLAEEHIRKAANLLFELGEQQRLLACQCALAECANRQGDLRGARHQALEALAVAKAQGWPELAARAANCLGNIGWQEGKLDEAEEYLCSAIVIHEQNHSPHQASSARSSLGVVYALQNRDAEATELLRTAMQEFQDAGDLARMVRCLNNLAGLAFQHGDANRAREYLLQCVELEQDIQDRGDLVQSWYNLGVIEMHEQQLPVARKYFHRAMHLAQEVGDRATEGSALVQLGIASLLDSDPVSAMNYILLSDSLFAGSSSTSAQVVQFYKPVFFLANGHYEFAQRLWQSRPAGIEANVIQAVGSLLRFMLSSKFICDVNHDIQFRSLCEKWFNELEPPC